MHLLTAKSTLQNKGKPKKLESQVQPDIQKIMVVSMFILGICLGNTAVIYYDKLSFRFELNGYYWKAPPRVFTILHPWPYVVVGSHSSHGPPKSDIFVSEFGPLSEKWWAKSIF